MSFCIVDFTRLFSFVTNPGHSLANTQNNKGATPRIATTSTMSNLEGVRETSAMLTRVPVASSDPSTSSIRITDMVDLTLSDDERRPDGQEKYQDQDDNDTNGDSDNDSVLVMPDGPTPPAPIYNAPLDMDAFQPDLILPCEIEWPFILKVNKDTPGHLITLQFVDPSLFGRHLEILNPQIRFTTAQYKAAWIYAVNQCRDKVDLTATLAANPGLDQSSFVKLIDDEFEKVLVNVRISRDRKPRNTLTLT